MRASPVSPDLVSVLKRLRLGCIAPTLCDRLQLADKQSMSHEEFLLLILSDEVSRRDGTAVQRRSRDAKLDPEMTLERFDKTAKISYDKRLLAELCSLRFLESHKHITVMGPVGVGKTFIASAIGHIACRHGYNVYFTRADQMLQLLKQSRFDNSRDDRMVELTTVDLLILDDFALDQMSKEESRDIYQLFVERTDRASMIVTTNRDTSEWLAMFDDTLRAQSAVDRFRNAAYDLVIDGETYRSRLKPKLDTDNAPPQTPAPKKPRPLRRSRRDR
jgi:DNA replication protein DnaC